MKTNYTIKNFAKRLVMVLAVGLMAVNAWGTDVTWDYTDSDDLSSKSPITVTYGQGSANNNTTVSSSRLRLYPYRNANGDGSWITFTISSGYTITAIQVDFDSNRTRARGKIGTGSWADVFGAGSSTVIDITGLSTTSYSIKNGQTNAEDNNKTVTIESITITYVSNCDKSVTISKGTGTNCTFTLSTSGAQASCDGVSTTVTVSPNTGYGSPSVTQSGASAAPTITGSGNSWTVAYGANTTGTSTINVSCTAKTYTVTLNDNGGSGGSGSKTVTYNANTNMTSAVAKPTQTHYDFGGYWTSSDAGTTLTTQIIDENGAWKKSVTGYTDATPNWIRDGGVTLYAKWTEHGLTNYRTRCCDPTGLAFGSTYYTLTRQDIQGSTTVWDTINITFSTSSSGTVTAIANGSSQTAWQFTGSGTWETRATTGGTAASTSNHAVFKITDAANGKAIFCVKNNGGSTGQGTYRFGLTQAADGSYCESTVWCWADVTVRDKFVDAVNGNSTINRDGHGTGGEQMKTPAEADLTEVDECHDTTRRLRGWIKETDLQTQYNNASKETGYLENAANYNSSQIIAPYANITTSGCTWYAVWGVEK